MVKVILLVNYPRLIKRTTPGTIILSKMEDETSLDAYATEAIELKGEKDVEAVEGKLELSKNAKKLQLKISTANNNNCFLCRQ